MQIWSGVIRGEMLWKDCDQPWTGKRYSDSSLSSVTTKQHLLGHSFCPHLSLHYTYSLFSPRILISITAWEWPLFFQRRNRVLFTKFPAIDNESMPWMQLDIDWYMSFGIYPQPKTYPSPRNISIFMPLCDLDHFNAINI